MCEPFCGNKCHFNGHKEFERKVFKGEKNKVDLKMRVMIKLLKHNFTFFFDLPINIFTATFRVYEICKTCKKVE